MTMVLEGVNFLILVWLLKRFFYLPILAVIDKRQARSEKITLDAEALQHKAEALMHEYAQRLADAAKEHEQARARLDEDIAAERARRLETVAAEVDADRQRRHMLEEREQHAQVKAMEREAIAIAGRFASRLLDQVASPELEHKLIDLALLEMGSEDFCSQQALQNALQDFAAQVKVESAYPLDAPRASRFSALLSKMAGRDITPEFAVDAALKSGVCLKVGSWVLMANLRDELNFFGGTLDHGG